MLIQMSDLCLFIILTNLDGYYHKTVRCDLRILHQWFVCNFIDTEFLHMIAISLSIKLHLVGVSNWLHGTEVFLRRWWFLSWWRSSYIVCNLNVFNHVHMNLVLESIWSQLNPLYNFISHLLVIHLVFSSCLHLGLPGGLLHSGFLTEIVITS